MKINFEELKARWLFIEEFEEMTQEELLQCYEYCKLHANYELCRKNLAQIRYVCTKRYLGTDF